MLTCIDLFSGCGGLSFGFHQAGFRVLLGVDHDSAALTTFENNHPGSKTLNMDVSDPIFIDELNRLCGSKNVDVIVGGPPCQGFSLTGPRKFDDPRNSLYLSFLNAIDRCRPKAFLIENVPGIATMYDGQVKDTILSRCEKIGYNVKYKLLCAADYGVPQMRKRVVFVGVTKDIDEEFLFPDATHNEDTYVSCEDAISDLPPRNDDLGSESGEYSGNPTSDYQINMRNGSNILTNHVATRHTELVKNVISQVPEGGNHKDLPPGVGDSRKFNEAWTRYHGKKPSRTIDTGHRNHFHYKWNRVPTIRENARLQSFPDAFVFYGNKTQQNRQVGNAVPPLMSFHIANQIHKLLD